MKTRMNTLVVRLLVLLMLLPAAAESDDNDLRAATYLGGGGTEGGNYSGAIDAAVAATGEIYVAGMTASANFPVTPGAYQCTSCGAYDVFVAKLSRDLTTLLAATKIGGSLYEEMPAVTVSSDGTVYVAGHTNSADFPATAGAYDTFHAANNDVFVARFSADLTTLLAATYLGGNADDYYVTVDLDPTGDPVVCGVTSGGATNTFPTTPGAYDRTCSPNYSDFFVSKLSGDLSQLLASTFLGGRYGDSWGGARVDRWGNIFVGGSTESDDYPSTPGAYDEYFHGPAQPGQYLHDVVISKLSSGLDSLLASTFIGTSLFDGGMLIILDDDGNPIIGGHTESPGYPVTPGALDEDHNGQNEYMLTKMDGDLTTILASTFLTPDDAGFTFLTDLAADGEGNVYGVGAAWSADCPTTPSAYDTTFNGGANDFNVLQLSADMTTLVYGTFLGGSGDDGDCAVAVDSVGLVATAGYTGSLDMPATPGAYDETFNGGTRDAFIARFRLGYNDVPVVLADFFITVEGDAVTIKWRVSEDATAGDFQLTALSGGTQWSVPIAGVAERQFEARDNKPAAGPDAKITYRLYSREGGGPLQLLRSESVEIKTPDAGVKILGVYPSPSARDASLTFTVGSARRLEVDVYDVAGRRTARLAGGVYPAGRHVVRWDGRDDSGRKAASGVYFFRVSGFKTDRIRKFVLVR